MTNPTVESFFDNSVRSGAPGALLKNIGDLVHGEVVDQYLSEYLDFATKKPVPLGDGTNEQQLVIVIQTDQRNWAGVSNIPVVDRNVPGSPQKPASEDDGKRAVYVRVGHNLHAAIGKATAEKNGGTPTSVANGSTLGVKIYNLKPTDKGNPLKEHQAIYTPPVAAPASADFFGGQQAQPAPQQQAPAQQQPVQQAPAQNDPFGAPPAQPEGYSMANPPQANQAPTDPWTGQAAGERSSEPPF